MLLLLGCADEVSPFANRSVTTTWFEDGGDVVSTVRRVEYDDQGRVVTSETESLSRLETVTTAWEGQCPVRSETLRLSADEVEEMVYSTSCDAHDNIVERVLEYRDETDGEIYAYSATSVYANSYDDAERLVRVEWSEDGEAVQTRVQGWADCELPTRTSWFNPSGDFGVSASTCDAAGRVTEVEHSTFDADENLVDQGRTRFFYGIGGNLVEMRYDDGPGTEVTTRSTQAWGAPFAPGPTAGALFVEGVRVSRWTAIWE